MAWVLFRGKKVFSKAVKHMYGARHLAFLKLDKELNLVILFTKNS